MPPAPVQPAPVQPAPVPAVPAPPVQPAAKPTSTATAPPPAPEPASGGDQSYALVGSSSAAIPSAIIGARTVEQARDNMLAANFTLGEKWRTRLDEVSRLPHRYPEAMERNWHERRDGALDMPSLEG